MSAQHPSPPSSDTLVNPPPPAVITRKNPLANAGEESIHGSKAGRSMKASQLMKSEKGASGK